MSCLIAAPAGGDPRREIFPMSLELFDILRQEGRNTILQMMQSAGSNAKPEPVVQHIGAALMPDGSAFYLTTIAPDFGMQTDPVGDWAGGFFAHFGVGDVVGSVQGKLASPGAMPTTIAVKARLLLDPGGNPPAPSFDRTTHVSVDWVIRGNQATRTNKAAMIDTVTIHAPGPHDRGDIRRCVALHAPQRCFGVPRAIVAMQCGVAAACLIEAIC